MKLLNDKVIRFFSKLVNLQRFEILAWCEPVKFEMNINNLCAPLGIENSNKNGCEVVDFKDCCNKKELKNGGENKADDVLKCG